MVMSNVRVTGKDVHVFESSGRLEREVVRGRVMAICTGLS